MNARVFLVILLSAIFMAVWDTDQKAMDAALAKKQQSSDRPVQVAVTKHQPRLNTIPPASMCVAAAKGTVDAVESFIPLPRSLANGTWQAIAESGEVYSITIDRTAAARTSPVIADESIENSFAIFTAPKGDRWCFVRSHSKGLPDHRRASTEIDSPVK